MNKRGHCYFENNRSQVTIFIILAIVIVAAVILYFVVSGNIGPAKSSTTFDPVYTYFDSCIKSYTESGIELMGTQAGYIQPPAFSPGSDKYPTSSQLDFFNFAVPYWYYVSGNGIVEEQIPQKSLMEKQLSDYIASRIKECDFSSFLQQGYDINISYDNAKIDAKINDLQVSVDSYFELSVSKGTESARKVSHSIVVNSKIGKFYSLARGIYQKEQSSLFLENYGIDTLRLYNPVDGVEITCAPKVWNPQDVISNFQDALAANTGALKVSGNDYTLNREAEKYFVVKDISSDEQVNFMYDKNWPFHIEIWPADNGVMIAKPVGTQQGLGILGFCYVPYHYVYDVVYPVLIQITDNNEIFQFPVAVVIDKNTARKAPISNAYIQEDKLCKYKLANVDVYTYDTSLNPVEADISFKCFDSECNIGKTAISGSDSLLSGQFPQCLNGFILASAEGYEDASYMISTNTEATADILMQKLYPVNITLEIDNMPSDKNAIIYFTKDNGTIIKTAAYPQQKEVELSEGQYEVEVQVYGNSSIYIPPTTKSQCTQVPSGVVGGLFGITKEQCFNFDIPGQTIDQSIIAGGKTNYYIAESELADSTIVEISVSSFPVPKTIEDVQKSYELLDTSNIDVVFKK